MSVVVIYSDQITSLNYPEQNRGETWQKQRRKRGRKCSVWTVQKGASLLHSASSHSSLPLPLPLPPPPPLFSTSNARVTDPSLILFYTLPAQVRCLVHSPPHLDAQLTLTRSHWLSHSHSRLSHEPTSDEASGSAPLLRISAVNVAHVLVSTSRRWRNFECIDWRSPSPGPAVEKPLPRPPGCPSLSIRFFVHTLQLRFRLSQGLLLCLPHRFRVRFGDTIPFEAEYNLATRFPHICLKARTLVLSLSLARHSRGNTTMRYSRP